MFALMSFVLTESPEHSFAKRLLPCCAIFWLAFAIFAPLSFAIGKIERAFFQGNPPPVAEDGESESIDQFSQTVDNASPNPGSEHFGSRSGNAG